MNLRYDGWIALVSVALAAGCSGRTPVTVGQGDSEGTGTTGAEGMTTPQPPTPNDDTTGNGGSGNAVTSDGPLTTGNVTTSGDASTGGGGNQSCCEAHASPGCNELEVLDCVCEAEASCCAFEWSQDCVDLAINECDAACEDPPEPTTTGVGADCTELIEFEMQPSEAILTGDWFLGMSGIGEGEIVQLSPNGGTDGSVLFEPDIPCTDTWYIWVRYWESGSDDSYFATLDGMPMPEAIFEGDCGNGGQGYDWTTLNWRDPVNSSPCEYVEDPWAPQWDVGVHAIEFTYRESLAMGRILLTNDPDLVP